MNQRVSRQQLTQHEECVADDRECLLKCDTADAVFSCRAQHNKYTQGGLHELAAEV